jgi:hypothetical protein
VYNDALISSPFCYHLFTFALSLPRKEEEEEKKKKAKRIASNLSFQCSYVYPFVGLEKNM